MISDRYSIENNHDRINGILAVIPRFEDSPKDILYLGRIILENNLYKRSERENSIGNKYEMIRK